MSYMNIKKVIKDKGWTLERLAAEMMNTKADPPVKGVSQATLSQMLGGNPTLDKLKEISSIIGVPLSELVSDGEPTTAIKCPHCGETIKIEAK